MRTALELQNDVLEELRWEPSVEAAGIGVSVADGVVTLTGTVQSYSERTAVEKTVKRVKGVKGVANELQVRLPFTHERTDSDLAAAALNALTWHTTVPESKVTVTVTNGWITLDGEVEWYYQKEAAYRAVRDLTGVKGVVNRISIKAKASPGDVRRRIEDRFRRSAELDAGGVKVVVDGSTVTLQGTVSSWDEHDEAQWAAWSAPGVEKVKNELKVSPEVLVTA